MEKRSGFKHLTAEDRDRIHALYGHGHTQVDIAKVLGVTKGTISRELGRYDKKTWRYSAARAQKDAEEKRSHSKCPGMKIASNPELKRHIIKELKRLRSPDEIAGRMRKDGVTPRVGTAAIYKWLYSEDGKPYCRYLCTRRSSKKRQKRASKKVLIPERVSLENRPTTIGLVHTEGDLFVSPTRSRSTACGLLVVEKDSLLFTGEIVPDKKRKSIIPAMQTATSIADTCTLDNGIENVHHRSFGVATYFCDPGTPTQKPHVEGGIGLLRRWFIPKGTNLSTIADRTYKSQLHYFNHKYRKSLGYQSAYEHAKERGIIDRVPRISLHEAVAFR
jgi:IS30 family transposase